MQVSKTIETPDGSIKFEGELTQEEADFVVKVGLSVLMQNGTLPFIQKDVGEMKLND